MRVPFEACQRMELPEWDRGPSQSVMLCRREVPRSLCKSCTKFSTLVCMRMLGLKMDEAAQRARTIPKKALQEIVRRSEGVDGNMDEA